MAGDLNYLADRMVKIAEGINVAVDNIVKDVATQALFHVVYYTPVDVGTARSNWAVGVGSPFVGNARPAFSPYPSRWRAPKGPGGSRAERANMFAAINLGKRKITARRAEQDIYITNHLPYIARLNDGYSPQTQAGFARLSVVKAAAYGRKQAPGHLKKALK